MKKFLLFAMAAASAVFVRAQAVTVSGKVSDADGKPLAGVIVKLLTARLEDTTGADGRFDFTGKSIAILSRSAMDGNAFYRNGRFSLPWGGGDLEITLHDLRGVRVARLFHGRAAAGRLEIPFAENGYRNRALVLRVRSGERVSAFRLSPALLASGGALAEEGGATENEKDFPRAKTAAGIDWLQAYKSGYAVNAQEIPAYGGAYNITLTASSDPDFGPNVLLFDPAMPMAAIQKRMDDIHAVQATAQFGSDRWAYLFKPGAYALNVDVGYYMQALGLGQSPEDVAITGSARSISSTANSNVTLMFWRACENMSVTPTGGTDTWAVSQGAAFRRMHVKGNLSLSLGGWASGGFLGDSKIDKQTSSGSQQQWYTRNTEWGSWSGGVWNMFFDGVNAPPAGAWPNSPYTVIAATPKAREKPYLYLDAAGKYSVMAPALRENAQGASWSKGPTPGDALPIELFYIAHPATDNAATLNAALASGKHLLLTPGIYHLDKSLQVVNPGTVVLGLGMANLVADNGTAALSIADVDGVRIAGLLIDAGSVQSPVLLQVGEPGSAKSHAANPTSLHDIFIRVGGPRAGSAVSAVIVNSNDVIGDHFWLWRADHGAGAGWDGNKSRNGLVVNGNDVSMYALFVEHFQEYQVLWNGEGGLTHFYQSEMPYDPPNQAAWGHDGVNGYASYKVAPTVKTHEAWGLGVYCAFHADVQSDHAIEAPAAAGVRIRHAVSVFLNGSGGIGNVLNATGGPVGKTKARATVD